MRRTAALGCLLLVSACAGDPTAPTPPGTTTERPPDALDRLDWCTIFTPQQEAELGITEPGEPFNFYPESGCQFNTELSSLSLGQNTEANALDFYRENSDRYIEFENNRIAGRDGARMVLHEATCSQAAAAGRRSVLVQISVLPRDREIIDPCTEVYRITEMIEPRLPPVGE